MATSPEFEPASLEYRLHLEKVLASAAMRFVAQMDLDQAIDEALADAGGLVGADRAYLFGFSNDGAVMSNTHEWCAPGVSAQLGNLQNLPSASFPWIMRKLRAGQSFQIEDVAALPAEAAAEREVLAAQDIHSCLIMPIQTAGALSGFVGFDNVRSPETWRTEHVDLLCLMGHLIGNALERAVAYRELAQAEQALRRAIEVAHRAEQASDAHLSRGRGAAVRQAKGQVRRVCLLPPRHGKGSRRAGFPQMAEGGNVRLRLCRQLPQQLQLADPARRNRRPHPPARRDEREGRELMKARIRQDGDARLVLDGVPKYIEHVRPT